MLMSIRQVAGLQVTLIGWVIIGSGVLINPWVARLTKGPRVVDYQDVLSSYFWWSLAIGATIILLGRAVGRRTQPGWIDGFTISFIIVGSLIIVDRFLLTRFSQSIWQYDAEIIYRHRPNAVQTLTNSGRPTDLIRINRWGHHDTDFPKSKPDGEFRGLILGDSVAMGDGLTYDQTFSKHLEDLLAERDHRYKSYQIINTGVHGYTTYQELKVFSESMVFEPDFVAIGFAMNDVTEPFVTHKRFGGTGLDYHKVTPIPNPILAYLANETGFGRLRQMLALRSATFEREERMELYNVREMAAKPRTDPRYQEPWKIVLDDLAQVYQLAAEHDKPIVLMIFPFSFQLIDEQRRMPQAILTEHAREHNVDVIDFTDIFARLVYDDQPLIDTMRDRGYDNRAIEQFHDWKIRDYFLDTSHPTEQGQQVIAKTLMQYIEDRGLTKRKVTTKEVAEASGLLY